MSSLSPHEVDEFLAGVDAQFRVDMLGVGGRCLAADDELIADVGDGAALGEQREHLRLAGREAGLLGDLVDARRAVRLAGRVGVDRRGSCLSRVQLRCA